MQIVEAKPNMTTQEAADYLREAHGMEIKARTLQTWRQTGRGPASKKIESFVYYSREALDTFATKGTT